MAASAISWFTSLPLHKNSPSSFLQNHNHRHNRSNSVCFVFESIRCRNPSIHNGRNLSFRVYCNPDPPSPNPSASPNSSTNLSASSDTTAVQVYRDFERLITDLVRQSQDAWGGSSNWREVEGAWVLEPRHSKPWSVVHFIGGIFVGAAPQLAYRLFLESLCEKGVLVIATPYASGFDHFSIADEVQFKFDRSFRCLQEKAEGLPTFGIGHSLGSVLHLLIGSRYAVQRKGNILMAFNNKDPTDAIPLFSPVFLPMTQSMGPLLSQLASSETIRLGAETTLKQLENLSPPIMKQVLPLFEQLPPLYMDLAKGRENFNPKPEETRRLIKAYYGVNRNLLIKFKDDIIDETSTLAQVLSVDSGISSMLDLSIRALPGDHGTPLQQALPDVPPAMSNAVNRGGELLSNLIAGTPWETVAKDVSTSLGMGLDSQILRAESSKELEHLVDVVSSWMSSSIGSKLLR
ncbi:unnamed protein product [Amaranthus hypochondriacus]